MKHKKTWHKKGICTALAVATLATTIPVASAADIAFTDISATGWYYETVQAMADRGYISGYSDGTFRPDDPVTNAEYATMIAKAFLGESLKNEINGSGYTQKLMTEKDFPDSVLDDWWTPYVMAVGVERGWRGTQDMNTFSYTTNDIEFDLFITLEKWTATTQAADNNMSRYDMIMAIDSLYMYSGLASYQDLPLTGIGELEIACTALSSVYSDWPTNDHYVQGAIARMTELGIITGNSDGTLNLYGTVTRAEMATILSRIDNDTILQTTPYTTVAQEGAYDMTKYTVPADFNLDGILTEDEVQQMLDQLQEEFPQGTYLGDAIFPSDGYLPIGTGGYAWTEENDGIYYKSDVLGSGGDCIAWAYFVSDSIFGDLPAYKLDAGTWTADDLRIGDIFYQTSSHINVIISTNVEGYVSSDSAIWIQTTDSGAGHEISWASNSATNLITVYQPAYSVLTRYPS